LRSPFSQTIFLAVKALQEVIAMEYAFRSHKDPVFGWVKFLIDAYKAPKKAPPPPVRWLAPR
jgi:hypothetical protein